MFVYNFAHRKTYSHFHEIMISPGLENCKAFSSPAAVTVSFLPGIRCPLSLDKKYLPQQAGSKECSALEKAEKNLEVLTENTRAGPESSMNADDRVGHFKQIKLH